MDINMICAGCMNVNAEGGDCPVCGCKADYQNPDGYLPVRHIILGRYIVGKAVSSTCESIIYIAYDNEAGKTVNIKEYFPENLAERALDKSVMAREGREKAFENGSKAFKQLNNKLMDIDLPSLPKTQAVFDFNDTVYVVTDAITGITLKEFLKRNDGRLKWEQARPLFLPLIDTLNELNKQGIIHGGISPESILISRNGLLRIRDILINSARKSNKIMAAQIYGGYAAIEQYNPDVAELGSYTDVYGISATLFRTLIGNVPDEAPKRMQGDTLTIPSHFAAELPRQVLVAMANGLQVLPENRTETVERFRDELVYGEIDEDVADKPKEKKKDKKNKEPKAQKVKKSPDKNPEKKNGLKIGLITAGCTVLFFVILALVLILGPFKDKIFKKDTSSKAPESEMPSVASIGEYDSSVVDSKPKYSVPDFTGITVAKIKENEANAHFTFEVIKKVYSSKFAKGTVCEQSVKAGKEVIDGTLIKLTVSLGPEEFSLADVTGLSKLEAQVGLLRQGILFDNIEVVDKYDSDREPGVVLEQSPSQGSVVNEDVTVRIYVNSYNGEDEEDN